MSNVIINESWGTPRIEINEEQQRFVDGLYYLTKSGNFMQVWPQNIYKPILESLVSNNPLSTPLCFTTSKGKNHLFQIAPQLTRQYFENKEE